ncbi:hypothetical protein PHYPO_G00098680 [Pangasianodon hypophthalmus]|uniref:Uncharacterized protein n=1 Tax=Pangasianodon hypophthalmus TaxID=310915 RepID=A0A5N5LBT4_PANHP|nr:hypothetical protein PHYPO_G00098680 [Pangasianodon hypophthalmus]
MESAEIQPCFSRKPPHTPAPAGSQLCGDVQTETCTASGGGTSSSLEPVDHQKHVKKEEPEDEDYLYEATSASVGRITPVDQEKLVKKEEPEDEGYLRGGTSNTMEKRGFQSKDIKEEESEDEDYLCTTTVWEMSDAQFHVFSCSWSLNKLRF